MFGPITSLSNQDLVSLVAGLRSGRIPVPVTDLSLLRLAPAPTVSQLAAALESVRSGGSAQQLATTLELLRKDRVNRPHGPTRCDLVTTGPEVPGVVHRGTAAVVRELFASAERRVIVVGYAVHGGARIFESLANRIQDRPEMQVRLYLDVRRSPGDASTNTAICQRFLNEFRDRNWPRGMPLPEIYYDPRALETGDRRAVLHAKCVVVDDERVFISSANLTEAAQQRNIELGLLVTSTVLADQTVNYFERLRGACLLHRLCP